MLGRGLLTFQSFEIRVLINSKQQGPAPAPDSLTPINCRVEKAMFALLYLSHKRFKQKLEIEKRRVSAHLGDFEQFDYTTKEQLYLRM